MVSGSRFRQNFLRVARANVLAQLLPFLAAPILTRLYTPGDFGAFAILSSMVAIAGAVAILRLDWSVPNAKTRLQAAMLIFYGGMVLLSFCCLLAFAVWLQIKLPVFWESPAMPDGSLMWLAPVILGTGFVQLLQAWHIREAELAPISRAKVFQSASGVVAQIGLGALGTGVLGLMVGSLCNAWGGVVVLSCHTLFLKSSLNRVSVRRLCVTIKRFWRESFQSSGVAIVNAASLTVLPLLFAKYYTPAEVGAYGLMYRLAVAPVGLITSALGQSFWAEAASRIKSDSLGLRQLYIRTTKQLVPVALLFVVVCLAGPLYVGVVFGDQWTQAGWVLAALAPMLFGQIVFSPLSHLVIHRKQHWQFWWDLIRLAGIFVVFGVVQQTSSVFIELIAYISLFSLIMYVILFLLNLVAGESGGKQLR